MSEAEWLEGTDPQPMLEGFGRNVSDRKLRLFACACCRQVWHLLADARSRRAVEVAERLAEGTARARQVLAAYSGAGFAEQEARRAGGGNADAATEAALGAWTALRAGSPEEGLDVLAFDVACNTAAAACYSARGRGRVANTRADNAALAAAEKEQAALLRDVVGNPFRPVTLDPAWRNSDVRALARAAYEERVMPRGTLDPTRLALLADALEDAGCHDGQVLGHLRGPGPHVRGCWAVDLILGKG